MIINEKMWSIINEIGEKLKKEFNSEIETLITHLYGESEIKNINIEFCFEEDITSVSYFINEEGTFEREKENVN